MYDYVCMNMSLCVCAPISFCARVLACLLACLCSCVDTCLSAPLSSSIALRAYTWGPCYLLTDIGRQLDSLTDSFQGWETERGRERREGERERECVCV